MTRVPRFLLLSGLLLLGPGLLGGGLPGRAAEKPGQPGPDRLLKLFVSELVELKPGSAGKPATFSMGSEAKTAPKSETPAVRVTLTGPLRIARYEVTQELYELVMDTNPSRWKGPRNSVEMVSWDEARSFCKKLTTLLRERKLIRADEEVRLPSEAEWEYACRAGTTTAYSFGAEDLGAYAWFLGNSKGEDPPVGKKKPNAWGLYDMHGYVWEWCEDGWHPTHEGADPSGKPRVKADEKGRVIRGGSWAHPAERCRSAARERVPADTRSEAIGFRCVVARSADKLSPATKEGK